MSITGNLKTMQLAELLQWLSQGQKTGTLVIHSGEVEKRIFLKGGKLESSASTDPNEYLGHFLVSQGLISEEQLNAAIQQQEVQKQLLGKILVDQGAVEQAQLQKLLRLKAEESIYDIFTWSEGEFRFIDDEVPDKIMVPLNLDVTGIIMEGARRVDEWHRIRERISNKHCVPVLVSDPQDPDLDPASRTVMMAINDERTVEEIRLQTHSSEFHVCSVLYGLLNAHRIKVIKPRIIRIEVPVETPAQDQNQPQQPQQQQHQNGGQQHQQQQHQNGGQQHQQPMMPQGYQMPPQGYQMPPQGYQMPPQGYQMPQGYPQGPPQGYGGQPGSGGYPQQQPQMPQQGANSDGGAAGGVSPLDPDSLLNAASERIGNKDFDKALKYLRSAKGLRPDDKTLASTIQHVEGLLRSSLEKDGVNLRAVPKLAVTMDQLTKLDVSAQEGFILSRLDGRYDIKSILKISPMDETEALILFWRLKTAGHIQL